MNGITTPITMRGNSVRPSRLVSPARLAPADYEAVFADPDQMSLFMPAIATIRTVLERKSGAKVDAV